MAKVAVSSEKIVAASSPPVGLGLRVTHPGVPADLFFHQAPRGVAAIERALRPGQVQRFSQYLSTLDADGLARVQQPCRPVEVLVHGLPRPYRFRPAVRPDGTPLRAPFQITISL